jgi:hypothetical protein
MPFILIKVPNFNGATGSQTPMTSYLRIGATDPAVTPGQPPGNIAAPNVDPNGEDLASLVTDFADDARKREAPAGTTADPLATGESLPAGSTAIPNDGSPEMREHESALLHLKGGWRDHSDGNRVTTTRGDKVEVIRGNYRMLVLGRRDPYPAGTWTGSPPAPDLENATSWDVSGGLADYTDPGENSDQAALSTEYVWQPNSETPPRWGWTARSKVGSYQTPGRHAGNGKTISYTWVDEQWIYVGSPQPDPLHDPGTNPLGNPDAFVADSAPKPVKKITAKTWGETIVQETHAVTIPGSPTTGSLTSTTWATGDVKVDTHASGIASENHATDHITTVNMTPTVGTFNLAATTWELDIAALITSIQVAAMITEVKGVIHNDIHPGIHMDVHLGIHDETHVGIHSTKALFRDDDTAMATRITALRTEMSTAFNHSTAELNLIAAMLNLF